MSAQQSVHKEQVLLQYVLEQQNRTEILKLTMFRQCDKRIFSYKEFDGECYGLSATVKFVFEAQYHEEMIELKKYPVCIQKRETVWLLHK